MSMLNPQGGLELKDLFGESEQSESLLPGRKFEVRKRNFFVSQQKENDYNKATWWSLGCALHNSEH